MSNQSHDLEVNTAADEAVRRSFAPIGASARLFAAVTSGYDVNGLMSLVRDIAVEECGFDRAGVFLYDPVTETMRGTWGTDSEGRREDISSDQFTFEGLERGIWEDLRAGGPGFTVRHFDPNVRRDDFPPEMAEVQDHCSMMLAVGDELVGYLAVDNLLSSRPITEQDVEQILPFVTHAAVVLHAALLRDKRTSAEVKMRRIMEISVAITTHSDPDAVFLLVRNAILEISGVERASVWIAKSTAAHGTWGTSETGALTDEHDLSFPIDRASPTFNSFFNLDKPFELRVDRINAPDGKSFENVPHAFVPLKVKGELIGFIAMDMFLSRRKITDQMIESILPLADLAAVAIQKDWMLQQKDATARQQERIMEIAAAIAGLDEIDVVLRMVRDAILETSAFDRAGVWLVEGLTSFGTWGTDEAGLPTDEHGFTYPFETFAQENPGFITGEQVVSIDQDRLYTMKDGTKKPAPYAVYGLRAGATLVGVLTLDNLLTGRKITTEAINLIASLAKQAAVAVVQSRLLASRNTVIQHQQRLMEISSRLTADKNPDNVLRLVRDAVLESKVADRVGVWLVEGDTARGTWGTSEDEVSTSENVLEFSLQALGPDRFQKLQQDAPYVISEPYDVTLLNGTLKSRFPNAIIPIRAQNRLVGILTLDNVLTTRSILSEDLEILMPLAKQAAIAILNLKLRADREAITRHQRRLMEISTAVMESQNIDSVFRMVRDAIMEVGAVDRVAVWLIEDDLAWGTWGTDVEGQLKDEHTESFSLSSHPNFARCIHESLPFLIDASHDVVLANGEIRANVPHGLIPLRAGDQVVGFLIIDMLLTMRELTPAVLDLMLPLVNLAAIVVQSSRLFAEAQDEIERRAEMQALLIAKTQELIVARNQALAATKDRDSGAGT